MSAERCCLHVEKDCTPRYVTRNGIGGGGDVKPDARTEKK